MYNYLWLMMLLVGCVLCWVARSETPCGVCGCKECETLQDSEDIYKESLRCEETCESEMKDKRKHVME